jgi:U32 family peptidase
LVKNKGEKLLKKIELLSPAGNLEKLKIALNYGADAVYGGVSHFSLRQRSGKEFHEDSFREGIEYAHARGKEVFTTINGFPFTSQLKLLENHIAKMRDLGPDAFIVSTPGVIKLVKKIAPDMPIHLSTQANVMNYLDAEVYADMGVTRIIAAREMSLRDLEEIKNHIPSMELEMFVHGSMCFAFSGRCLITSLQTGRVANRGSCANDCRFPYKVFIENPDTGVLMRIEESEEGSYIFNAKDLNLISYVDEIAKSGIIDSIKIEGRTKSSYYAGVTALAYRAALEGSYAGNFEVDKYESELDTTKNRGFSDGYIFNRPREKDDTQNHETAMSDGSYQVDAFVVESGEHFLAKGQMHVGVAKEMLLPVGFLPDLVENEIGKVELIEGQYFVTFRKFETEAGKLWESVHSGNINLIKLPVKLPPFTFIRSKIIIKEEES